MRHWAAAQQAPPRSFHSLGQAQRLVAGHHSMPALLQVTHSVFHFLPAAGIFLQNLPCPHCASVQHLLAVAPARGRACGIRGKGTSRLHLCYRRSATRL